MDFPCQEIQHAWYDVCLKILFVGQAGGLRVGKTQGEPAYEPSPNKRWDKNKD
jgi:hypothetical protein